jgi:hypothetical protein
VFLGAFFRLPIAIFLGLVLAPSAAQSNPICDLLSAGAAYNEAAPGQFNQKRKAFFSALHKEIGTPEALQRAEAEFLEIEQRATPEKKRVWIQVVRKLFKRSSPLVGDVPVGLAALNGSELRWFAENPTFTRSLKVLLAARDGMTAARFGFRVATEAFSTAGHVSHANRIGNRYLRTLGQAGMGMVQMVSHFLPLEIPRAVLFTHREIFQRLEADPHMELSPAETLALSKTSGGLSTFRVRQTYLKNVPKILPSTTRGIHAVFRSLRWAFVVSTVMLARMENAGIDSVVASKEFLSEEFRPDSNEVQIISQGLPLPMVSVRIDHTVYSFLPDQMAATSVYEFLNALAAPSLNPAHVVEIRLDQNRVSALKKRLELMSLRNYPRRYDELGRSAFVAELLSDYGVSTPPKQVATSPQLSAQWYAFAAQMEGIASRAFRVDPEPARLSLGVAWDDLVLNRAFLKFAVYQWISDAVQKGDFITPVDQGVLAEGTGEIFGDWKAKAIEEINADLEFGLWRAAVKNAGQDQEKLAVVQAELLSKIEELKLIPMADLADERKSVHIWAKAWFQISYLMELETSVFGEPSPDLIDARDSFFHDLPSQSR